MQKSLTALMLTALMTNSAVAIELTDYQNPETSFNSAYLDFSASAKSGNQERTSYNALTNLSVTLRNSGADQVWGLNGNGAYSNSRGPNSDDPAEVNYGVDVSAFTDRYLTNTNPNLFYFGVVDFASERSAVDDSLGLTAGIGYGRVWNATPLAKALRFVEKLDTLSLLDSTVSDNALKKIADVIAKEEQYKVTHGSDEYKGVWYADIESVLVEAGASDGFSALATVTLEDVLFNEPISARRHGWLVRVGAGFQATDLSGITDNDPKLTLQAEYAMPVGLKGQWIDTFTYEPIFGDNTVQSLNNTLSYTYEISDRVDWVNVLDSTIQLADDANDTRFTRHALSSGYNFHLTNQLDLGVTLALVDTNDEPNLDTSNDEIDASVNMSMSYRLK